MKKIIYSILIICTIALFTNCTEDDSQIFIADLSSETIAFQNSFANEYLLSEETEENIADRFIWNATTLGVNNDYEVQAAIDTTFTTPISIGITNETNYPVLVGQLLNLAIKLGLDDDPETTDDNGNPNNIGTVYFRVKSIIGNGGAGTQEIVSDIQDITIKWLEKVANNDASCEAIWVVGDAIENVDWNFSASTNCEADVQNIKLSFKAGKFRFFEVQDDWGSSLNYAYYEDNGYAIDANFESEGEGDFNFVFVGTPGIYSMTIDNVNKTIVLIPSGSLWAVGGATPGGWDFSGGETELVEISPDIWQATFAFSNDIFRFFETQGEWDINNNYAHYEDEGYTIDANFENDGSDDANFKFIGTPGTYTITVNAVDNTIALE